MWDVGAAGSGAEADVQTLPLDLARPGPAPAQTEAKPHQAVVDPTRRFMVVPDLGADLLRLYALAPGCVAAGPVATAADADASVASDSLSNYRIDPLSGALAAVQTRVPSGGRFPRQLAVSPDGALVAVTNQLDGRVVLRRDPRSGRLGPLAATARLDGNVTAVIF